MSRSLLCISTSLGIDQVAAMAGKSRCVVSLAPTRKAASFYQWDFVILQRVGASEGPGQLTLRQSFEVDAVRGFRGSADLNRENLMLIRNSPEEIRDVGLEALQYQLQPRALSGENLRRQRRFWEILERHGGIERLPLERRPRIGSEFLRNHEWWLE